ncbi:hypothetical protein Y032_0005g2393 [Ancylostoma ceylanicum]|uniref:Uncharacterized protein n=1 Tax=Ancylostoma ceylanicum TaxID=53326 RepID=A0A016VRT3_9BILA|nr:hypothetical protein Y032_0005g2393 [Ancylostoma ceylanicum]
MGTESLLPPEESRGSICRYISRILYHRCRLAGLGSSSLLHILVMDAVTREMQKLPLGRFRLNDDVALNGGSNSV